MADAVGQKVLVHSIPLALGQRRAVNVDAVPGLVHRLALLLAAEAAPPLSSSSSQTTQESKAEQKISCSSTPPCLTSVQWPDATRKPDRGCRHISHRIKGTKSEAGRTYPAHPGRACPGPRWPSRRCSPAGWRSNRGTFPTICT